MSHWILWFSVGLIFQTFASFAQKVHYSPPQKLNSRTPSTIFLGKNKEGIILYKFGRYDHIIEAYSSQMTLRWKKNLAFKQDEALVKKIVLYPEKTNVFFIGGNKTETTLFAQQLNARFQSNGERFLVMDTLPFNKWESGNQIRVFHSESRKILSMVFPIIENNRFTALRVYWLDEDLLPMGKRTYTLEPSWQDYQLKEAWVSDRGQVWMMYEDSNRNRKKGSDRSEFRWMLAEPNLPLQEVMLPDIPPIFGGLHARLDPIQQQMTISGLFANDQRNESKGWFYYNLRVEDGSILQQKIQPFTAEILQSITGKDSSRQISGLSTYEITDLIPRVDGGYVMIAESRYQNQETFHSPAFVPAAGPNFRTVSIIYYADIMVASIHPEGYIDWVNVLRKKQVSEDDDGFFSSYCLMNTGDKIRLLYNEEIYHKTNVQEFVINEVGKMSRSFILNSSDENILMVPRLGKQISSYEVLIPSFRRQYIRYIKLDYPK